MATKKKKAAKKAAKVKAKPAPKAKAKAKAKPAVKAKPAPKARVKEKPAAKSEPPAEPIDETVVPSLSPSQMFTLRRIADELGQSRGTIASVHDGRTLNALVNKGLVKNTGGKLALTKLGERFAPEKGPSEKAAA
jgi:hypothetical protein